MQRVSRAEVRVGAELVGRVGRGLLALVGVAREDDEGDAAFIADKLVRLRVFADEAGKMNLSVGQVGGALLLVSQFTLLADTRSGSRPGFGAAMAPGPAEALYRRVAGLCRDAGATVEEGRFGAHMEVELVNDGPVTLLLDSRR